MAICRDTIKRKYMKTQFEDFQKMNLKKTCKAIEEMTYTYVILKHIGQHMYLQSIMKKY